MTRTYLLHFRVRHPSDTDSVVMRSLSLSVCVQISFFFQFEGILLHALTWTFKCHQSYFECLISTSLKVPFFVPFFLFFRVFFFVAALFLERRSSNIKQTSEIQRSTLRKINKRRQVIFPAVSSNRKTCAELGQFFSPSLFSPLSCSPFEIAHFSPLIEAALCHPPRIKSKQLPAQMMNSNFV